jgi:hypothetical protein
MMVHENLQLFLDKFVRPIHDISGIVEQKANIRGSDRLNEFLFDNIQGLREIYEETLTKIKGDKKEKKSDPKSYT